MKISLRTVVIAGVAAGLLVPMTIGTWYTMQSQEKQLYADADGTHSRATDVLSIGVSKALWDLSPEGATPLVKSVFADGRIVSAQVLDAKGGVFYEEKEDARRVGTTKTLERNVLNGEEVIGKVRVEFSFAAAAEQIRTQMRDAIILSAAQAICCILILMMLISSRLLRPISRLKKQAELIARKSLDTPLEVKTNDEIGELGQSLEITRTSLKELFGELERKNAELAVINGNLEKIVEERTATIKLILDHVKSGFLLINTRQEVLDGYTKSCAGLLGRGDLAGKQLGTALGLANDKMGYFATCVEQVFEDFMPGEVTLSQMPRRFKIGDKTIAIDGSTVRKPTGEVDKILFTIVDITALDQVEAENRANRAMVNIMKNLNAFKEFVVESQERLGNALEGVKTRDDAIVRRELHTLKGNSSAFGLEKIASVIHEIEDQVEITSRSIADVEQNFQSFLDAHFNLLKVKFGQKSEAEFAVSEQEISDLLSSIERVHQTEDLRKSVLSWTDQIRMVPVGELLGPLENYVYKLAADRGKDVEFEIVGRNLRVNQAQVKAAVNNLIHLIRNSIDHGIEAPEGRGDKGAKARLVLEFRLQGNNLVIVVSDDGKGIDTRKVVERAVKLGLLTKEAAEALSPAEALKLIYVDGLSTANSVTDSSGRGVGMSAVQASIEALHGTIGIDSKVGFGTTFTIMLPLQAKLSIREAA
jgi:signal transduction histidine kinase